MTNIAKASSSVIDFHIESSKSGQFPASGRDGGHLATPTSRPLLHNTLDDVMESSLFSFLRAGSEGIKTNHESPPLPQLRPLIGWEMAGSDWPAR
jgi:hypothetical protein